MNHKETDGRLGTNTATVPPAGSKRNYILNELSAGPSLSALAEPWRVIRKKTKNKPEEGLEGCDFYLETQNKTNTAIIFLHQSAPPACLCGFSPGSLTNKKSNKYLSEFSHFFASFLKCEIQVLCFIIWY